MQLIPGVNNFEVTWDDVTKKYIKQEMPTEIRCGRCFLPFNREEDSEGFDRIMKDIGEL